MSRATELADKLEAYVSACRAQPIRIKDAETFEQEYQDILEAAEELRKLMGTDDDPKYVRRWTNQAQVGGLYRVRRRNDYDRLIPGDLLLCLRQTGDNHYAWARLVESGQNDQHLYFKVVDLFSGYARGERVAEHFQATVLEMFRVLTEPENRHFLVPRPPGEAGEIEKMEEQLAKLRMQQVCENDWIK